MYSKLQDDQIRLLDVIETVNGTPCHKLVLPDMDLQERFEHSIDEREHVTLELNRCIAIPPVSRPLSIGRLVNQIVIMFTDINIPFFVAKKKSMKYTHVTVLMYSTEYKDNTYGLSLNHEVRNLMFDCGQHSPPNMLEITCTYVYIICY